MSDNPPAYGKLCSLFYDAAKGFAPEREVNFYASFIEQQPGRVLEAMSGSGRLQIPLVQRGYVVDGVDNSSAMLARCKQRCAELGVQMEIYEQSLTALQLPHRYTTVTIAVGSFQLIVDRTQALMALKKLHEHMVPGGNLLIDIFTPDTTNNAPDVRIVRLDDNTTIKLTTRYVFDEQRKIADGFCAYELIVNGQVQEREDELIEVTWYTDTELAQLLEQAGFELVKIYDETFRAAGPSRVAHAKRI